MPPTRFERWIVGIAVAVPVTIICSGAVFALGLAALISAVIGGGMGAICGLTAQHYLEGEEQP